MNSVWSRLVTVLLFVVAPIGLVMVLVARDGLDSGLDNLRTTQVTATVGRGSVLRSWFDAAGRAVSNEAAAARMLPQSRCQDLVKIFLSRNSKFVGARFLDESGQACAAGETTDLPAVAPANAVTIDSDASFRVITSGGQVWVVAIDAVGGPQGASAVGFVRPEALASQLQPVATLGETDVALLDHDQAVVLASGSPDERGWIPDAAALDAAKRGWTGRDAKGREGMFVLAPLADIGLSVLMRFDETRGSDAQQRFYVVCALQLALLGLLVLAYAATVRRDIVRWIRGVEDAARERARDPESQVLAPLDRQMPTELRSVADAFNTMATRAREHQNALKEALADNRVLMLEMHHRIKNSLQVIQSYLSLIRRTTARAEAGPLLKIESRISVLAVAYRLGLTPGGLRGIPIQPFLEEIGSAAITNLKGPRQLGEISVRWNGELDVDRAIPLGLGLVEALIAAFGRTGASHVAVTLNAFDAEHVRLAVEADGEPNEGQPPERIMAGLAAQLGATSTTTSRLTLCWDFRP